MSETNEKSDRIRSRIEASQDRLSRESNQLPALPSRRAPPEGTPPEDLRSLAREHPLLVLAAGAGAGLLIGALLPKRAGFKVPTRALGFAATGVELALALSKSARETAGETARDGLHRIDEGTAPLRRSAGRAAGQASRSTRAVGVKLAGEAIKLASRLRK